MFREGKLFFVGSIVRGGFEGGRVIEFQNLYSVVLSYFFILLVFRFIQSLKLQNRFFKQMYFKISYDIWVNFYQIYMKKYFSESLFIKYEFG